MYNVSVSPHIRTQDSTKTIMGDVCIALIPVLAFGFYHFGLPALLVTLLQAFCSSFCLSSLQSDRLQFLITVLLLQA